MPNPTPALVIYKRVFPKLFPYKQISERVDIQKVIKERVLILDGAMGTMIQRYNLEEEDFRGVRFKEHSHDLKGNNDLLSLTRPDIISKIHRSYLEAGADIIETNTFSSTSIAQSDYHLEDLAFELNYESARIACEAARSYTDKDPDKPRFVAGSMGPTNKTASISPEVTDPAYRETNFDDLAEAYKEQARGLMEGGSDLLLVETIFDTLNAKAALFAIQELFEEKERTLPVMISGTITDASGRTLSGQTVEAFLISVSHAPVFSVGLNCALGAEQLKPYLKRLSKTSPHYISAYPNAGLPNEFGEYDQSPDEMAALVEEYLKENIVHILGGCCGTTPDHIRKMSELAEKYVPVRNTEEG